MFWVKNVYVAKDNNEKVWKSVTNFRRRAGYAHRPAAERRRQNIMYNLKGGGGPGSNGGSITDKIQQSFRFRAEEDMEGHGGTLKGGLLKSLSRQRSTMMMDIDTESETVNGLKKRVKSRSPDDGSQDSPKALLPMKPALSSHSGKGSLRVEDSDHSTDSEEESDHSERDNRNKRVAVNDLFTQVNASCFEVALCVKFESF